MKIEEIHYNWKFKIGERSLKKYFCFLDYNKISGYCCICGFSLDIGYLYIIEKLRQSGLLPEDHNVMCCNCYKAYYTAKNFGEARPRYRGVQLDWAKKKWRLCYPNLKIYPSE